MIVVAHRGSSGSAPENTMAAFKAAVTAGADMIELDVRFSAECTCVVMHDRTLRRTTSGRGFVHSTPLSVLQSLDAGSWFSARFARERIPTLAEVFHALPHSMGVNCEIKTEGDPRSRRMRARILAETLARSGAGRRIIVSSFDHRFLSILSRQALAVTLGILVQPLRDLAKTPSRIARRTGATSIFCSRRLVRHRLIDDAHAHGLTIGVYTVDTPAQLAKAQRYGVDLVFTNYPEKILSWLARE
jgi:glycerophosphoryl diester phosphodiesterase